MPNCMLGFIVKHFWHLFSVWQDFPKPSGECQLKIKFWWLWWNLKLNLVVADLSRRFGVSDSFVSMTVKFWIDTLAIHLTNLIVWLPREIIKVTMPSCFERYPNTTCILDCAETIMQKASNLKSRGESYSNDKSHDTVKWVKYCVSIAPNGLIMHISRAYGGRASDKFIVQDCGILNRLVPGDEVMADRGFTIQDLLVSTPC